ncbi:hypothetical protein M0R45_005822 [Rubus argutus]|uniref:Leucine-rich repeat-containing N-terminal plant-type domain-containing protein n=1 Tax=Rubus argutus TaxID=59490 RepID=A0AAW1YNW4_RUBAR
MSAAFSRWHPIKPIVNWLMLFILLRISFASTEPDVEGEALIDLLRALNDSNGRITDWNDHFVSPCYSWSHVTCRNGNVISLSLASNEFSGTLSPSITKLKFLASLDFQDNSLKGLLPVYLANLTHLQNLNLANNNFRGPISNTWGQLSNLKHLDLSSNDLTGRIPMQLFTVPTFNFTGTRLSCGSSLKEPCASGSSLRVSTKKSKLGRVVTSASCGATILLFIAAIFLYRYYHMRKPKRDVFVDVAGEDDCKISLAN